MRSLRALETILVCQAWLPVWIVDRQLYWIEGEHWHRLEGSHPGGCDQRLDRGVCRGACPGCLFHINFCIIVTFKSLPTTQGMFDSNNQAWHSYFVWIATTAVSMLTTKMLLVGDFEQPISLLLLNVSVLTIIQILARVSQEYSHIGSPRVESKSTSLSIISFLAFSTCICACLILEYKAIKFTNSLTTAVLTMSLDWQPLRLFTHASESRFLGLLRVLVLAFGFFLIHAWDFRLNKTSRDMSIAFVVLIGVAELTTKLSYLENWFFSKSKRQMSYCVSASQWPTFALFPIAIAAYFEGSPLTGSRSFSTGLTLAVNITATAIAYHSGNCLPRPLQFFGNATYASRTASMLALSGLVSLGCCSVPSLAVINSPWQYVGFFAAVAVNTSTDDVRQLRQKPKRDFAIDEEATDPVRLDPEVSSSSGDSVALPTSDSEQKAVQRDSLRKAQADKKNRSTTILLICALFSWLGFLRANLIGTPSDGNAYVSPRLDTNFVPKIDLDVVVARYDRPWEDTMNEVDLLLHAENLQDLQVRIIVYNKGVDEMDSDELVLRPNLKIIPLENIGREGGSYLEHIVSRWDELARQTLFIQEWPHDTGLLRQRIADYLAPSTGFMSLSYAGVITDCHHPHDRSWSQDSKVVSGLYEKFNSLPASECKDVVLTYRGQFIASGARIRGNDKSLYEGMLRELQDPESWMHSEQFTNSPWNRDIRPADSLKSPVFGYTLERMWGVMMQCSNARVASRNPSLLGAYVHSAWFGEKFPLEDVQCLDGPIVESRV